VCTIRIVSPLLTKTRICGVPGFVTMVMLLAFESRPPRPVAQRAATRKATARTMAT